MRLNPQRIKRYLPAVVRPAAAFFYHWACHLTQQAQRRWSGPHLNDQQMETLLIKLGFQPGATIFLHASMNAIQPVAPSLTPQALLQMMLRLLGTEGTLLMPTYPFRGRQIDHVAENRRFVPARTPSRMGILSEIFRRTPGVLRSLHPTHPVAAWGRHAQTLLADHHRGRTFDHTSPFCRLRQVGGLVAGLGVRMETFTILYVPEELNLALRQRFFSPIPVAMTIETGDGILSYPLYPRIALTDYANLALFAEKLLAEGSLRYFDEKGLKCAVASAAACLDGYDAIIRQGLWLSRLNPDIPTT